VLLGLIYVGAACGEGSLFGPSGNRMEYVVEGRATEEGDPSIGIPDVQIDVFGLKSDGYSYIMTTSLTDAEGFYSVSFRGRVTDCPEPFPDSRPPGYHLTATKDGWRFVTSTAICGVSPQTWDFSTRPKTNGCFIVC